MRDMSSFEDEYRARGVEFVTVNSFEPVEAGREFAAASGLHYTWLRAEKPALEALGVQALPTQVVLDPKGEVVWTSGLLSVVSGADAIKEALDGVMAAN